MIPSRLLKSPAAQPVPVTGCGEAALAGAHPIYIDLAESAGILQDRSPYRAAGQLFPACDLHSARQNGDPPCGGAVDDIVAILPRVGVAELDGLAELVRARMDGNQDGTGHFCVDRADDIPGVLDGRKRFVGCAGVGIIPIHRNMKIIARLAVPWSAGCRVLKIDRRGCGGHAAIILKLPDGKSRQRDFCQRAGLGG